MVILPRVTLRITNDFATYGEIQSGADQQNFLACDLSCKSDNSLSLSFVVTSHTDFTDDQRISRTGNETPLASADGGGASCFAMCDVFEKASWLTCRHNCLQASGDRLQKGREKEMYM